MFVGKKEVRISINAEKKCGYLVEYRNNSNDDWHEAKVWSKGANDYYRVYLTQNPYVEKERIYLHTLLAMYYFDYSYKEISKLCVHHVNRVKKCNDLINLLVVTPSDHMKLHWLEDKYKTTLKAEDYAAFIEFMTPFCAERADRMHTKGMEFLISLRKEL